MDTVHTVARVLLGILFIAAAVLAVLTHGHRSPPMPPVLDNRRRLLMIVVEAVLVVLAIDWSA